jgi:SAM-dependent methyltransferase
VARPIREGAFSALAWIGLLRPAYRSHELFRSLGRSTPFANEDDALPLPPARLRTLVAGTPDAGWFLESGRLQAALIAETLERHGAPLAERTRLLDFGCGCGRILRHWYRLRRRPEIFGSDYNKRLIRWCVGNLPYARFSVNTLRPPLDYPSEFFDAVYAFSVFTHLPADLQRPWAQELSRILKPTGLLLLTVHGDSYRSRLSSEERSRYSAGELVVRRPRVAGTNLCTTFHPEAYVRGEFAQGLEVLDQLPEGAGIGSPRQDLVVLGQRDRPCEPLSRTIGGAYSQYAGGVSDQRERPLVDSVRTVRSAMTAD